MSGIWIIMILVMAVSWYISYKLKSKFKEYSQTSFSSNLTGKEVAEKMLKDHGIYDVKVISVSGQLTDHYNPVNKTVNLSDVVYHERNAAAAAVAAHEVGHAVQHATAYAWLNFRSKMVPILSVTSRFMQWILLLGVIMIQTTPALLGIGILLFSFTTLFSFITLPVEYDASKRALQWMGKAGVVSPHEYNMSKDALNWAARTYVVAAIGSLATLLYYVSIFMGRRD